MDMCRLLLLTICLLNACISSAASSYQIDLILFAHSHMTEKANETTRASVLIPVNKNAISLQNVASKGSYQLLKASQSTLSDEYYQLTHKKRYQVLAHYSWRQPAGNQSAVAIPAVTNKGWQMQGTLRVRQSNYYLFDSELQFAPPGESQAAFTVNQKQRLKPNVVYYLDHPQIGMIIKVHALT